MKINIKNKKILFLGFGAVAKCTLNYFDKYFIYDINKIYVVDKCKISFYGPDIDKISKNNKIVLNVNVLTFESLIKQINLKEGDIIIDLTFFSSTYYFIHQSLIRGFNYINTSIEDDADQLFGSSIDFQQKVIEKIYSDYKKNNKPKSNILTEFGQNPGLIQHYILYSLNHLNKINKNTTKDDYNINVLIKVIDNYKIGTIFVSEIDNMIKRKETSENKKDNTIYNTWSVAGLLGEGFDKTELVCGKNNKYIKPIIPENYIDYNKMNYIKNNDYNVYFLNDIGIKTYVNSVCPIIDDNEKILFKKYSGSMIHHGEVFELAKLFGKNAPFMSYVYKINKYADRSIKNFIKNNNPLDVADELQNWILNNCKSFHVFDNINKKNDDKIIGHDSIGCTLYCGDKNIEKIYWCGIILGDHDQNVNPLFTPTIIQVAAGVLSGLSYIMEPKNKNKGLLNPCDLDTKYILEKSTPLLGKFFFTEIPTNKFDKKFTIKIKN